jgi:hypothetical protein
MSVKDDVEQLFFAFTRAAFHETWPDDILAVTTMASQCYPESIPRHTKEVIHFPSSAYVLRDQRRVKIIKPDGRIEMHMMGWQLLMPYRFIEFEHVRNWYGVETYWILGRDDAGARRCIFKSTEVAMMHTDSENRPTMWNDADIVEGYKRETMLVPEYDRAPGRYYVRDCDDETGPAVVWLSTMKTFSTVYAKFVSDVIKAST